MSRSGQGRYNEEETSMPKKEYSYAELKGVIRVGDVVSAVPGKENCCRELDGNGSNTQKITAVDDKYFWINGCLHGYQEDSFLYLHTQEITWDTLKAGDVLEKTGEFIAVLDIIGNIIFTSSTYDSTDEALDVDHQFGDIFYTKQCLQAEGFTIVQPEEATSKTILSKAEIEKRLGLDEGSLEIEG